MMKYVLLLSLSLSFPLLSFADTVELAECPKAPDVVGEYFNNGKRCIRKRKVQSRSIVTAECKPGWDLVIANTKAFCKAQKGTKFSPKNSKPFCPTDYQRYGGECHSPCPQGFSKKKGSCIQLADKLPNHYMTCPSDKHKFGAFCCESDQCSDFLMQTLAAPSDKIVVGLGPKSLTECKIPEIPGKFYFSSENKKCERQMTTLNRVWSRLPRDSKNRIVGDCQEGETLIQGGCQANCPESWKVKKGMCQLRPCSVPLDSDNNSKIVLCPDGKYQMMSASI